MRAASQLCDITHLFGTDSKKRTLHFWISLPVLSVTPSTLPYFLSCCVLLPLRDFRFISPFVPVLIFHLLPHMLVLTSPSLCSEETILSTQSLAKVFYTQAPFTQGSRRERCVRSRLHCNIFRENAKLQLPFGRRREQIRENGFAVLENGSK